LLAITLIRSFITMLPKTLIINESLETNRSRKRAIRLQGDHSLAHDDAENPLRASSHRQARSPAEVGNRDNVIRP
jgi:hypothetical protein